MAAQQNAFADLIPKSAPAPAAPASNPFLDLVPDKPAVAPETNAFADLVPKSAAPKPVSTPAKPRPGATLAEQRGRNTMPLVSNLGGDVVDQYVQTERERRQQLGRDFTTPLDEKKGGWALPARAGKVALDALNYAFSLGDAAFVSAVGRPVEAVTGGRVPREVAGGAAQMLVPVAGEAAMVNNARRVAKATGLTENSARVSAIPAAERARALAANPTGRVNAGVEAVKAVQKILAPSTVNEDAAATGRTVRRRAAEAQLATDRTAAELMKNQRIVANLPVEQQREIVNYVENRSKYPNLQLRDPKVQAAADALTKTAQTWRSKIEDVMSRSGNGNVPNFIEDFYSHMWKEPPGTVRDNLNVFYSKQGSGRNLKARSIPTLADGIAAGLTPKNENPIESMLTYSANMSRYLSTHEILNDLKESGLAKMMPEGSQPDGWVPLQGIMTSKPARTIIADGEVVGSAAPEKMYAPADAARVFNNYISKGFETTDGAPLYEIARSASNGLTQLKLGLSGFHAVTMANESMASEFARLYQNASRVPGKAVRGNISGAAGAATQGAKALGNAFVAPVTTAMRGGRMRKELLGEVPMSDMSKAVNDAFVRSGQRIGMDKLYRSRGAGSFFNSLRNGTFKRDLQDSLKTLYTGPALDRAKGAVDLLMNGLQTTAAPLFEMYIPAMKRGAFAYNMEDWLRANPGASQLEIDKAAIRIGDSIDNRFGEMVQDNLFWKKQLKQAAQLALLSPTWNIGTIREIGGGVKDIPKSLKGVATGEGITERTAYNLGLATNVALQNAALTYLKTGKPPEDERDLMNYRTGGVDASSGEPERAITPGYQKEVYTAMHDFPNGLAEAAGHKLNPALQAAIELVSNRDYRGLPIRRPKGVEPIEGEPTLGSWALDVFTPISVGQVGKGGKIGSNITDAERILAIRPAPSYMTAPERDKVFRDKRNSKAWQDRIRADARLEAQYPEK